MGAWRRAWWLVRLVVGWSIILAVVAVVAVLLGSAVYGLTQIPAGAIVPLALLLGLWGWLLFGSMPPGNGLG